MDFLELWRELPVETRETILRVLLAALVLLMVWALRSVLARVLLSPLRRLTDRTPQTWDSQLLDAAIMPVRILLVALGLVVGAQILQVGVETSRFVDHLTRSLVSIALFVAGYRAAGVLTPSSYQVFRFTGLTVEERLLPFVRTGIRIVLALWLLIALMQEWGYDTSGLLASGGLIAIGLGLAAQDTIANVFGFTAIVGDRPFVVGEYIKTPDVEGIVVHVGVRSTRIRQLDQAFVTVPNSRLASSAVLNWSRLEKRRVDLKLHIAYRGATSVRIESLLEQTRALLAAHELVEPESIVVYLIDFTTTGLQVLVRCYIRLADWTAFTAEKERIYLEIMKIMEGLGLSIAFPGSSVYIEAVSPVSNPEGDRAQTSTEERNDL